jgi:aspartate aminotransferase
MKKQHFVFFDSAYQGFASDDIDEDTYSLKLFAKKYLRVMLAQSFSKNFGLYGERTGCLSLICTSPEERDIVQTRLKETCLPEYSNPPVHGARIVDTILGDEELTALWKAEVLNMSQRLRELRVQIVLRLKALGSVHDWSHITKQIGMFAYTGLTPEMVKEVIEKHSIYMPPDGRISVAGVNSGNIDHVCQAFHAVSHGKEL